MAALLCLVPVRAQPGTSPLGPGANRAVLRVPAVPKRRHCHRDSERTPEHGREGHQFSCSALGSAQSATPPPGTRTSLRKQVKPDLCEARDKPARSHPAGACRISLSTLESLGKAPTADMMASAGAPSLSQLFPNIKDIRRFTLLTAKPIRLMPRRQIQETTTFFTLTRQNGNVSSQIRTCCPRAEHSEHPQGCPPALSKDSSSSDTCCSVGTITEQLSSGCWPR